ncbi:transposase InsO family protein [Thermoanaerobacterium thermosulfurigenes]
MVLLPTAKGLAVICKKCVYTVFAHVLILVSIYMVKYLYPYLLRGLNIDHPNQVWSIDDITYCRIKRGFMYLIAIIDWYSTCIVEFALSNTLEHTFVIDTIKKAIKQHGAPEIMNSYQGYNFL